MEKLFKAIEFAVRAHAGQYRKGRRVPYIFHPIATAWTLMELGCDEALVAAAVLHDTVEDTHVTLEDLRREFGPEVADIVEGCSEPDKTAPWEERKRHTIEHLKSAPMEVALVTCADKLDNIRATCDDLAAVGEAAWSKFSRSKEKQAWYYRSLVRAFNQRTQEEPGTTLFRTFESVVLEVFGEEPG